MMFQITLLIFFVVFTFGCGANTTVNNTQESPGVSVGNTPKPPLIFDTPGSVPSADRPKIARTNDMVITIERSACNGNCPRYSMSITANGDVEFEGTKDTLVIGKAKGKISEEDVKRLIDEFEEIGFFELKDKYSESTCPNAATDQSTIVISLTSGGKSKTIDHYTGCVENDEKHTPFPAGLLDLENRIHQIPESKKWSGPR